MARPDRLELIAAAARRVRMRREVAALERAELREALAERGFSFSCEEGDSECTGTVRGGYVEEALGGNPGRGGLGRTRVSGF